MAKSSGEPTIIHTWHTAARSQIGTLLVPLIGIPLVGYALLAIDAKLVESGGVANALDWTWYAVSVAVLLAFPLWAKVSTFLVSRYRVTEETIGQDEGFLSRVSSEIRVRDVRNIVVRQSLFDRMLFIGDVSFSSSAGDGAEVLFRKVPRPNRVKELVRRLQNRLQKGPLNEADIVELRDLARGKVTAVATSADAPKLDGESAADAATPVASGRLRTDREATPAAPAATKGRPPTESSEEQTDELTTDAKSARDDLYRLLAQQEAEGKQES